MRRLISPLILLGLLLLAVPAYGDIVDSLGTWSYTTPGGLYAGGEIGSGQSFTNGGTFTLDSVQFYITKAGVTGLPTGNIYAKIYSHAGTYGSSSLPGDSLCVSAAVDASGIASGLTLTTFTFSGANQITLSETYYVLVLYYNDGDASNQVSVGLSNNTSDHDGNGVYTTDNDTWSVSSSYDRVFYVFGTADAEGDTCCSTSSPLAFGNCDTNTTDTDSFYIYNCGDSALVDSIDWAGLDAAFTPMSDSAYNIASGVTTYFSVQFDPPDVAAYACTIAAGHDSCDSIIISGTGTDPALPCCDVYTSPLAFGSLDTGSTDLDSFYIKNCGSITALEDSIDWTGLLAGFTPQNDSLYNIAAGDSQWFSIQFAPVAVTSYADTIDLGHDSCGSVIITGTGSDPSAYPSGDNIFYLATDGSNDSSGATPTAAWGTLQYADDQLSDGDTLFIMGGIYSDIQYMDGPSDGIVVQAYGDSQAVFQRGYDGGYDGFIFRLNSTDNMLLSGQSRADAADTTRYLVLQMGGYDGMAVNTIQSAIYCTGTDGTGYADSITIHRVEVSGLYCGHGVDPETSLDYLYIGIDVDNMQYFTLSNCYVHHIGDSTYGTGFGYGVCVSWSDFSILDGNLVTHCGHAAIEYGVGSIPADGSDFGKIINNVVYNQWCGGIYVYGDSHWNLIENNLVYHAGTSYGDGEAPDYPKASIYTKSSHNTYRRNVVYSPWNQGFHLQAYASDEDCDSNMIYNNTFYHSGYGWGNIILNRFSGYNIRNNKFWNNISYKAWRHGGGTAGMTGCDGVYCSPEVLFYSSAVGALDSNTFHHNIIEARMPESLLVLSGVGYGGGQSYYNLTEAEAYFSGWWYDNISGVPVLNNENPDSSDALFTDWWYIQAGSPCVDAGSLVVDTIGTYVESLYPGWGWDTLAWYGAAPDIGAYETQYYDTCCSTPTDYDFGNVNAGGNQDNDFYISNCGDSTLFLSIGLSDSTEFTIQSGGGLDTLTTSQSCTISVRFEPDDDGAEVDTLTFGMDACDTVFLSGTGVTMNVADCSLSTASVDFGNVEIDSTEYATFRIFNVGETPCDTLELNITETSDTFGVYWNSGVQRVVDGDSLTVGVYFNPQQFGIHACTLQTGSDSCGTVVLTGTGIATPCCTESQSSFTFGLVEIDSSRIDTLFITNCDPDCTLTCNPDLADSTQYWVTWVSEGWDEWTLDSAEVCSLEITFVPLTAGEKLDTLTWTQDSCAAVYLSGTGINVADCSLSVSSIAFDNTIVGSSDDQSFYVYNVGTSPCDTLELTVSETCDTFSVVAGSGAQTILDGDSLLVTVRFTPLAAQAHACTLQTGCDSCGTVPMSGTGRTLSVDRRKRLLGRVGFGRRRGFWR